MAAATGTCEIGIGAGASSCLVQLEHDGLELNRVAVSASINDLVSRTRCSASSAVHRRAGTENRENNPMQSRTGPGSEALVLRCVRSPRRNCFVVTAQTNLTPRSSPQEVVKALKQGIADQNRQHLHTAIPADVANRISRGRPRKILSSMD